MDREEFERLRDLPGKVIKDDIKFSRSRAVLPVLIAEGIVIHNTGGVSLRMNVNFNPETGSKTVNVVEAGIGPICRLDVDGPAHRPAGRSHKHSVQTRRCQNRNLPDNVVDRPELSGKTLRQVFEEFCTMANLSHIGKFISPDEEDPQ